MAEALLLGAAEGLLLGLADAVLPVSATLVLAAENDAASRTPSGEVPCCDGRTRVFSVRDALADSLVRAGGVVVLLILSQRQLFQGARGGPLSESLYGRISRMPGIPSVMRPCHSWT